MWDSPGWIPAVNLVAVKRVRLDTVKSFSECKEKLWGRWPGTGLLILPLFWVLGLCPCWSCHVEQNRHEVKLCFAGLVIFLRLHLMELWANWASRRCLLMAEDWSWMSFKVASKPFYDSLKIEMGLCRDSLVRLLWLVVWLALYLSVPRSGVALI